MNRQEFRLRDCRRRFGEKGAIALVSIFYTEADSRKARRKVIKTGALVLGVPEKTLLRLVEALINLMKTTIVELDGTTINGEEFVFRGFEDGGLQ